MSIMIKLFIVLYLLALAMVTIFSVVWILTAVFTPEWTKKKSLGNNNHKHTRQCMGSIRFFLAVLLLVFSGQSLALFMPAGFQINTNETVVSNDEEC